MGSVRPMDAAYASWEATLKGSVVLREGGWCYVLFLKNSHAGNLVPNLTTLKCGKS